jgi:putative flippase GtrA
VSTFVWSRTARPLRFAFTGSLATLAQLTLLAVLSGRRWPPLPADAIAIVVSTEINFILSYLVTWRDRRPRPGSPRLIAWRWAAYHASVGGAAVINMLVFAVARPNLDVLVASALGTAVGAIANFFTSDRIVFRLERRRATEHSHTSPHTGSAAGEGTAALPPAG